MENVTKLLQDLLVLQDDALKISKSQGDGFSKYLSIIKAEIKNLERLLRREEKLDLKDLQGCNYFHLKGIYDTFLSIPNSPQIFKKFKVKDTSIRVDISTPTKWVKINARARYASAHGEEDFEDVSESDEDELVDPKYSQQLAIIDTKFIKQAKALILAAQANPTLQFNPPSIVYQFVRLESELPLSLVAQLQDLGIIVNTDFEQLKVVECAYKSTKVLNIDVTSKVAMVSEMTYMPIDADVVKGCHPLELQKVEQDLDPLLPHLKSILTGKLLVCTLAAFKVFKNIIETIGGEHEQQRALAMFSDTDSLLNNDLLQGLSVLTPQPILVIPTGETKISLPTWKIVVINDNPSQHIKSLANLVKLSDFHINVFGTGDQLKLTTVTANAKMQRALDKAGKREHSILVHPVRGLVEQRIHRSANSNQANKVDL